FLLVVAHPVTAQLNEAQARDLLAQKGIPEDTLRVRLLKKGFDPDRIRPDQVDQFQKVVIETIQEIEADQIKNTKSVNQPTAPIQPPEAPQNFITPIDPIPTETTTVINSPKAPIYGQEIFRNNSIKVYQKSEEIVANDDYVLGQGDKIGVVGFGRSQFEEILIIGSDGFVKPTGNVSGGLPRILLKGLRFGEAKEILFQRYNQYFVISRGQFQVTLIQPRNITVSVFGEARTPGAYTLPGFNTAFNVIAAAGGPTDIGSVRRIKVISGSQVRPLDVYEFMNDPGVARDFFLQNNDYIHIPVAEKVVTIEGAITRPMAYELLEKENLAQLIKFAGGIKANSYLSDVKITRFLEDRKVITNVNFRELSANGGDYILYNGDIVELKTIEDNVLNYVNISGAVQFPGRYERRPDMRISDLLDQSKLKPESRLDFAYLLQFQPDGTFKYQRVNLQSILNNSASPENIVLGNQDELLVMTLKTYADLSQFSVTGAVRQPDTFAFNPQGSLKLEDAILLAGGLLIDAADHGYIMRFDPSEPKTIKYLHVNLREAFDDPTSKENVEIKAGDQIVVYDKSVIRDNITVSIFGAVRNPGTYPYGPEMTIADLVNLAGGFKFGADYERIDIARAEMNHGQEMRMTQYSAQLPIDFNLNQSNDNSLPLMPYDHVYVRTIPEFDLQQTVTLSGEVKYPGTYAILQENERISDIIERAGGLTDEAFPLGAKFYRQGDSTGLVVINLAEILKNESEPSNVILLTGDVIEIPKHRDLVTIGGFVNLNDEYSEGYLKGQNSISVAFRGEKNAKYYIDNFAAGVSEMGSPSEIRVQFADGHVQKTKKFLFFNKYPTVRRGSIITVGAKKVTEKVEKENEKIDWGIILKDTLTQATAVLTI
ncbi:MAG TPA: SLBB domain-containing protein, partial [Saprospiraceae bacterium]|nr:SLBB domain-containing protein [Saprospiraceae bacterium]